MYHLLMLPVIFQGIIIFFDEFHFHHKRGLPKWEIIGHPLDTLTVIGCLSFVQFLDFSLNKLSVYIVLAIFSCLFITKDEAVHNEFCDAKEQWLHSVLFILHPLVLISFGVMWYLTAEGIHNFEPFLYGQLFILLTFLTYQIIYWGYYEPRKYYKQRYLSSAGRKVVHSK